MKKNNFQKLILMGLISASPLAAEDSTTPTPKEQQDPSYGNKGYHLMTDDELRVELNDEGTKMYDSLDDEGKKLARTVASQRCAKSNLCKGLNACATEDHKCAGYGSCKGTSKCGLSDKNLAVKLAYNKIMAEKRQNLK